MDSGDDTSNENRLPSEFSDSFSGDEHGWLQSLE